MINTFKTIFESRQDKFQQESVFHGECVDLVGTIVTDGVPNTLQYYEAHGIYQPSETTSGDVWYPVSTSISGNSVVLHWTPANEIPGYDNYTIYCLVEKVGDTSYPLTWRLNLAKSPGYPAHPVDPIPEQLDFSKYELLNAPWLSATETDTSWIVNKVIQVPGLEVSAVSAQDIVIDQGSLYDKITGLDDKIDGVSGDLLGLSGDFSDCCSGINDKLDGMSDTIAGEFETVNGNIAAFNEPISTIINNTDGLGERLYSIKSDTDGLPESIPAIQSTLDNSEYGLNAIKNAVDSINLDTSNLATSAQAQSIYAAVSGLEIPDDYAKEATLSSVSGMQIATNGLLNDETYGLEAIRNSIDGISFPNDYAKEATLDTVSADLNNQYYGLAAIRNGVDLAAGYSLDSKNLLNNSTYGLNALRSEILNAKSFAQSAYTTVTNQTYGNQAIKNAVDSINLDTSDLATSAQVSGVSADILSLSGDFSQCCTNLTTKMNVVSAGVADIQDSLGNSEYGLASINGALDSIGSNVNNINQLAIGSHGFDALAYDISQLSNDLYNVYYSVYDSYQKESVVYIAGVNRGLLQDGTYGLEAIKNKLNTTDTHATSAANRSYDNYSLLTNGTYGLEAIKGFAYDAVDVGGDIYSIVNNGTYGNSAIKTKLNTTDSHATSAAQQAKNAYDILNNGTYGNQAIKTKLDTTDTHATSGAQLAKSNNDLIRTVSANIGTEYSQWGYNSLSDMCGTILNNEGVIIDNPYFGLSTIKGNLVAASGDMVSGFNAVNGYLTNGTYGLPAIKSAIDAISIPTDYAKQNTLVSVSGDLRTDYLSVSGMLGDVAAALDIINGEVL